MNGISAGQTTSFYMCPGRKNTVCCPGLSLSDFFEQCDPTGTDPFHDEDISRSIEGGIVWVNEVPGLPFFGHGPDSRPEVILGVERTNHPCPPLQVFAEVGDQFVVLIEHTDTGMQVGYE